MTDLSAPPEKTLQAANPKEEKLTAFGYALRKLFAGRFILTVGAAYAFIVLISSLTHVLMDRAEEVDVDKILLMLGTILVIIQNVFQTYFYKNAIQSNNVNNHGEPNDLVYPPND